MNANETGVESLAADAPSESNAKPTGAGPASRLATLTRWIVLGEKTVACLFLLLIVVTMGTHVFSRYVLWDPFQWSEEVARLALIWMTFISAAFVMAEGRHIAVDMVSSRVGERGKLFIECLGYVVVVAACLLLMIGGARFVWYVGKVGSPGLGVPKSCWYGAGMIGLLLMAVHNLLDLFQVWVTGKPIPRDVHVEEEGFQLEMEQSA